MNYSLEHTIGFITGLTLLLVACQKGPGGIINVHPEFQIYVDRFVEEASKRGKKIDFEDTGLLIQFRSEVDKETGGVCKGNHHIEIELSIWEDLAEFEREGLIFHELGHCELDRRHLNDTLPNGEWRSRMRGAPLPDGKSAVIHYIGDRREYYIDELFDSEVPVPSFATYMPSYHSIVDKDKTPLITELTQVDRFEEMFENTKVENFEIEVDVDVYQTLSFAGLQFGGSQFDDSFRIVYNKEGRLLIDSGKEHYGTLRDIRREPMIQTGFNTMTVRRIDRRILLYINQKFIFWFEEPQDFDKIATSYRSSIGEARFKHLVISKLP